MKITIPKIDLPKINLPPEKENNLEVMQLLEFMLRGDNSPVAQFIRSAVVLPDVIVEKNNEIR